ncbi:MAG: hypothetical protein EOL91_01460 [Actinobacteria bacterium]|nr:hypothetical protein [Actinomycetota bacterium]
MVEFVNVPVPAHLVTEVMRFIAQHTEQSSLGDEQPANEATSPGRTVPWSASDLARLRSTDMTTARTVSALLDVLASTPDTWLTTSELETRTGIPRKQLKGALSALTRHIRKHYARDNWPMEYKWGAHFTESAPLEGHYRLDTATATLWRGNASR